MVYNVVDVALNSVDSLQDLVHGSLPEGRGRSYTIWQPLVPLESSMGVDCDVWL